MKSLTEQERQELIEWCEWRVAHGSKTALSEQTLKAAVITLEALKADPVCVIEQQGMDCLESGADATVWQPSAKEEGDMLLYAAPPAPSAPDERLYRLANHIAGAKGELPQEWQDWAEEVESDLRRYAAGEVE